MKIADWLLTAALVATVSVWAATPVDAQTVDTWTALQQVQADLKADRQAVVAANLPLSDGESKAFWPVYKQYRGEVEKVGERTVKLIAAYAANYETMDDAKADAFFKESLAIDNDRLAVRQKYVPKVRAGSAGAEGGAILPDREQAGCDRQCHARVRDPAGSGEEVACACGPRRFTLGSDPSPWPVLHVPDDLFPQDSHRSCGRGRDRALLRRRGRCARVGRGRLREAAADDRAALRHGLHRQQPRAAGLRPGQGARMAGRGGGRRPVDHRPRLRVRDPDRLPERECLVLQLDPRREEAAVRLRVALHSGESIPFTRQ